MYFENILKQVSKPSRYIPVEKNPFEPNYELEKIGLLNAGNYESSITSLFFQSLNQIVSDSKWATPIRFFRPDNDYLSEMLSSEKYYLSIDNKTKLNDCSIIFTYLNGDDAVFDYVLINKLNDIELKQIVFQESIVINPLVKQFSDLIIVGNDPFKLKQILTKAVNSEALFNELDQLSNDNIVLLDDLKGFGSLAKFISPHIDVKNSNNKYSYIYSAFESQTTDIFKSKPKSWESIQLNSRKKLNTVVDNIPNENEISLFPLGISHRIRQFLNVQDTYLNVFDSTKTLLAQGWRTIHFYFWIGHPLEEDRDWKEFRSQLSQIQELVENFKKISIHLHITPFVPSVNSAFVWDDVINPTTYKEKVTKLHNFISDKDHLSLTTELFSAYFMRIFGLRGDDISSQKVLSYFEEYVTHLPLASTEKFVEDLLEKNSDLNGLFDAQSFSRSEFNSAVEIGYEELKNARQTISKQLVDGIEKVEGQLNINVLKKSQLNHNIHLSKTIDHAGESLGTTEIVFGRSSKLRASQDQDVIRNYRVQFSKLGKMRYYSHLEIRNIILNAFKEAKIPVSMSKGFTPMPKIAFAMTASTGISSDVEYFDVHINTIKMVDLVSLNQFLPNGLLILQSKEIDLKKASLASVICSQVYEIDFSSCLIGIETVEKWLNQSEIKLIRETKNSTQELNLKSFIKSFEFKEKIVSLECIKFEDKLLRIEEFLSALNYEYPFDYLNTNIKRTKQLVEKNNGEFCSPMEV